MKRLILLVMLSTPLSAGPGNYIGIEFSKMWTYEGWSVDSSTLEVEVDSTIDTVFVMDTLDYLGSPAFVLKKITKIIGDGSSSREDTLWEVGNFLYEKFELPWDSSIAVVLYKTPFQVGDTWSLGVTGTYIVELDSPPDGIMDTVHVNYDKCEILGIETLTPPIGTVTDVYKIGRIIEFDLWISSSGQGGPFTGFGSDSIYEWVKPGLGTVVDSAELKVTVIVIIFPVTEIIRSYHALSDTGRLTTVKESPVFTKNSSIIIRNGEILLSFPEREGEYSLFDVTGRLRGKYFYRGNLNEIWILRNLPRGVYLLTYRGQNYNDKWKILLIK